MKKRTVKLMTMLLVGAMASSMLVACGNDGKKVAEDNTAVVESETNDAAADENRDGGDTSDLVDSFMESEDEKTEPVELAYDANGTAVAGTYVYDDYKADMDFSIMWTLVINEDGSYTLSEDNPFIGVNEYAGQTSEFDGNRVNCGEMDPDKATTEGDWAYPTGFSVIVDAETMTFQPENISDEVFGRDEEHMEQQ